MRNWTGCSGVYRDMLRVLLFLTSSLAVLAQQMPRDPLDTTLQQYWQARQQGRIEDAALRRQEARTLLQAVTPDSPRLGMRVQQVAQLFQNGGRNGEARAILQEACDRTAALGESHPNHIAMLAALGDSWRQDGNLLKALGYFEKAAALQASAPPPVSPPAAALRGAVLMAAIPLRGAVFGKGIAYGRPVLSENTGIYFQLADLYRQLGRPDAVTAVTAKVRALAANDPWALANFHEQHGEWEQAAAIYLKQAELSAGPQSVNAWQALANLNARQERYSDAAAAMQKAIAAAQSAGEPGVRNQALWMRQTMADFLRQAGLSNEADQVFQQLLQESQGGPMQTQVRSTYSQYLSETGRAPQGAALLKEYLDANSNLEAPERMNLYFALANISRRTGDSKAAESYQTAAQALQPQPAPVAGTGVSTAEQLQQAQSAANQNRLDEAYGLAFQAIERAAHSADAQQVGWQVPQIARTLAMNKDAARAEQLFQRAFAVAEILAVDTNQPLLSLAQNYVQFLMFQPGRAAGVPAAIERYRGILSEVNGAESATLAEPLRMTVEFQRSRSDWEQAQAAAHELLVLQGALSGTTSELYLGDLQLAAHLYRDTGDPARAMPLLRHAIEIADLLDTPAHVYDWRRIQTRMDAAFTLAQMGQFDDAIAHGEEAAALQASSHNPNPGVLQQLAQLHEMKKAAANNR
jgi:hypothetical protein